jgi:hypothetical protein
MKFGIVEFGNIAQSLACQRIMLGLDGHYRGASKPIAAGIGHFPVSSRSRGNE